MGTDLNHLFIPNNQIKREENLLLFSGRLVEKKGVNHLIKAFVEINKKLPDTQLLIVGDGPEKGRKYVLDNFSWEKSILGYNYIINSLISNL